MTSILMEVEDPSIASDDARITGLESQILNSQEIIVRLNRELDSALLRITTLETVCSENQTDLHEKRLRIKQLNDELNEREEVIERLTQDSEEKTERLKTLDDLIIQLKQVNTEDNNQETQIDFDRELRELILYELDDIENKSPQTILKLYQDNERSKFHDLLQRTLTTEDITDLIDSDDILFEPLTHLNSIIRLKDTLSHDSQQLQHLRSILHLTTDNHIEDLVNKRECFEYLRTKIDQNENFTDFELIKHVLHDYFNYQQQQNELKEYFHDDSNEVNPTRLLIERYKEAIHMNEQLKSQINESDERRKKIAEIVFHFSNQSIDQDTNEEAQLDRIRAILQSNVHFNNTLFSELSVSTTDDVLRHLRDYKESPAEQNQQLIIDELTKEIHQLNQQANERKNQLKELFDTFRSDEIENSISEEEQFDLLRSALQSSADFRLTLSNKLSVMGKNESILQRIDDYQMIIKQLNPHWTIDETLDQTMNHLKTMENTIEDLQKQLNDEKQLQTDIGELIKEFGSETDDQSESNLIRLRHLLESLTDFRQKQMNIDENTSYEKQDVESQTTDDDNNDYYHQIKELIGNEDDNPEELLNKIRELSQLPSPTSINELFSNNEKLRNLLNLDDEDLVEAVMDLNTNFLQLKEEYDILTKKENNLDKSIERLLNTLGLVSDSSPRTQIDEICVIFDSFCLEYCQSTSTDIEKTNLTEIFKSIPIILNENKRLKELISQIVFDKSDEDLDYVSKLQTYLKKVHTLCQLVCNENANIDRALIVYQEKTEDEKQAAEKTSDFKQRLQTVLSVENEEQIFDRLYEIQQMTTDIGAKLQNDINFTDKISSLDSTITEQRNHILEHEETIEKLRAQRERMLNKMKEMKTNNETSTNQLKQANQSLDDFHRKEIDSRNQIEDLEQQLRSAKNQLQDTSDECRTQQDLQETMKLEIESIRNEVENQRKLYESRCRQIINEKHQLDKTKNDLIEQKQQVEDDNKRLQTILHTIKDTLGNVHDINSVADTILKLRQDHTTLTRELNRRNEQMHIDNEKLLFNVHQQQSTMNEYNETKMELEKRLTDNEQELKRLKHEIDEKNERYQRLENEYQSYKEDTQANKSSQIAIIDIEETPISLPQQHIQPVQQAVESNNWMAIDMKDEEHPLTMINKHFTLDTPTALLNFLGELKSKLGITLTHRPRSSSVFFLYLCAVHLLTFYLLFIRHC